MSGDTETIREALYVLYAYTSDDANPPGAGRSETHAEARAALERVEEREAEAAKMLQDAQEMIEEHNWAPSSVHRAASILTVVRRARAALVGSVAGEEQQDLGRAPQMPPQPGRGKHERSR